MNLGGPRGFASLSLTNVFYFYAIVGENGPNKLKSPFGITTPLQDITELPLTRTVKLTVLSCKPKCNPKPHWWHLTYTKFILKMGIEKKGYWCTILISIPLISLVHHHGQSDVVHRPPPYALNLICSQPQPIKWQYGVYASNLIGKDSLPQPIRCGEYTYHLNLHASLYFPSTLLTLYHWTLL